MNSSARLPKQSMADAARATVKGTKADPGLKWRYSRSQVSDAVSRRRMVAAVCASVGGLSAMVQQERIVWGSDPRLPEIDLLKAVNTLASMGCALALFSVYWHAALWGRIDRHLCKGYQLDVLVPSHIVWWNVYFWFEATFSLAHVPPGVTFEVRPPSRLCISPLALQCLSRLLLALACPLPSPG